MSQPVVRTIVIEEKGSHLSVRFTPNPKEYPIHTKADAIHSSIYDMALRELQKHAEEENIGFVIETD